MTDFECQVLASAVAALVLAALVAARQARRRAQKQARVGTARRCYQEGLSAGQRDRHREWRPGQPLCSECPYGEGSDDYFIWFEGYLDASHPKVPSLPADRPLAS